MRAFPVPGKKKSADICAAFIEGAGDAGRGSCASVFYGVTDGNMAQWQEARADGGDWYYIDNSYFDATRGSHFRVTRSRLQHSGSGLSDGTRFAATGITVAPWQEDGKHVVICPQSDDFMRRIAGYVGDWTADTVDAVRLSTRNRKIVVREWDKDKIKLSRSLSDDLAGAWALVTWSSAAAITACLAGVPVFVESREAAAYSMSGTELFSDPQRIWPTVPLRSAWAGVLADNQWTLDEMQNGTCWKMLNGRNDT